MPPMLFVKTHRDMPPPVIILGMHRSGTSMLTEMLKACGLFVGRRFDFHHEARYFQDMNEEFLQRAGASWAEPNGLVERLKDRAFQSECVASAEARLKASFAREFLGLKLKKRLFGKPIRHWGWKDPRTCLTMPVWDTLFPEARLLHIVRHPLDVAISLERREKKRQQAGDPLAPVTLDLQHNLDLWERYVAEVLKLRTHEERYYELRFEDFMQSPRSSLEDILRFCGLKPAQEVVQATAAMADSTRTRRFEDTEYQPWLAKVSELPSAHETGYA